MNDTRAPSTAGEPGRERAPSFMWGNVFIFFCFYRVFRNTLGLVFWTKEHGFGLDFPTVMAAVFIPLCLAAGIGLVKRTRRGLHAAYALIAATLAGMLYQAFTITAPSAGKLPGQPLLWLALGIGPAANILYFFYFRKREALFCR